MGWSLAIISPICVGHWAGLILCGSCDGNHSWYKVLKGNSHVRKTVLHRPPLTLQPLHSSSYGVGSFILTHSLGGSQSMMEEKEEGSSWWWECDAIAIHMGETERRRETGWRVVGVA